MKLQQERKTAEHLAIILAITLAPYSGAPAADAIAVTQTAVAPAPVSIYDDDALAPGWTDDSLGANPWLSSPSPVAAGKSAIEVTFARWGSLGFVHTTGVSSAGLAHLEFEVNGGEAGDVPLGVLLSVAGRGWIQWVSVNPFCTDGYIPVNDWTLCRVPLSALGATDATITTIVIGPTMENGYPEYLPSMYFDEIALRGASLPIYSDALASGWSDISPASHNLANPAPVASGSRSISATLGPRQSLHFSNDMGVSTVGFDMLRLELSGSSASVPPILVYAMVAGRAGPSVLVGPYCASSVVPRDFTTCRIPLITLGAANARIDGVVLQEAQGNSLPSMYFDELAIISTSPGAWIAGYYAGYESTMYPPSAVDFGNMTHLFVAGVTPKPDGTLDTSFFIDPTNGPALARDLATRAHRAGRRAILMVGGEGARDGWLGATLPANLPAFVSRLLDTMAALGFDGLDLDWEPLPAADWPSFTALTQVIRSSAPNILLTVPFAWSPLPSAKDSWYRSIHPYFDHVHVMTYGMAGPWQGWDSWHSAALAGQTPEHPSSVTQVANAFAEAGVPKEKIGIGIGFFGSCWAGVTKPEQPTFNAAIVASDHVMTLARIASIYYSPGAYRWDGPARAGYLSFAQPVGPERCTFVSYEDDASIRAKGRWARAKGFGGAGIWTINQGYSVTARSNPPLASVKRAFLP